jgi:hypothetical protein
MLPDRMFHYQPFKGAERESLAQPEHSMPVAGLVPATSAARKLPPLVACKLLPYRHGDNLLTSISPSKKAAPRGRSQFSHHSSSSSTSPSPSNFQKMSTGSSCSRVPA